MSAREDGNAPMYAAGGGMAAVALAFVAVIIAIALGVWLSLYPIQSALSIGVWLLASEVGRRAAGDLTDFNLYLIRFILPAILALTTAIYTARLDQRLGERKPYWLVRHVIRVLVIGVLVLELHTVVQYDAVCYDIACFREAARLSKGIPIFLALAAMGIAHFSLTSDRLREWWHDYMSNLLLRPDDARRLGATRLLSALLLPPIVAAGLYTFPPDRNLLSLEEQAPPRRPIPAPYVSRAVISEAMVMTKVLKDVLGVSTETPTYGEIRPKLEAQGIQVTSDRSTSRIDSSRIVITQGDAGYSRGIAEVRYTFGENILTGVSIARSHGDSPSFDRRFQELRKLYKLEKQDTDWAHMTGKNLRLTLYVAEGKLVEYYEFVGHFERVR